MIEAVVFDAVGTLMHARPSVEAVYAEVGRRFGSKVEASEIRRRFGNAFAAQDRLDQESGWRTSEAREIERWRAIVAAVLDDVADPLACFEEIFAAFARPDAWTFDPEWASVSAELQGRRMRQAVASNFDGRLRGLLRGAPIEHCIISSEIGWRKPAPEFFAWVIDELRLPPKRILFVGDDAVNDYEPARQAGMRAVLFDPSGRRGDVDRIERLKQILNHAAISSSHT